MSQPSLGLSAYFTRQHREADERWAELETLAGTAKGAELSAGVAHFDKSIRDHLMLEEEVLFPAFEEATGMVQGPTTVMRAEHKQMRALLDEMKSAAQSGNVEQIMDVGDTLLTLIAQHNMKEEHMLYRMSEQALGGQWPALHARIGALLGA